MDTKTSGIASRRWWKYVVLIGGVLMLLNGLLGQIILSAGGASAPPQSIVLYIEGTVVAGIILGAITVAAFAFVLRSADAVVRTRGAVVALVCAVINAFVGGGFIGWSGSALGIIGSAMIILALK